MDEECTKRLILDTLRFMEYEVEENHCTPEEMVSIAESLARDMNVRGTIEDLARFYGQSESNVRNVISRRPMPKSERPKRIVTYRFGWFATLVPKSWRKK